MYGRVFCIINEAYQGLSMIGVVNTHGKTSHDRARELYTKNVPCRFVVAYDIKVKNPFKYKKIIHKNLKHLRCNPQREFFLSKPEDIEQYFLMENLIQTEEDKNDFAENYLTNYN